MSDNLDELGVNGEFEEDGREIVLDTSGEVELTDEVTEGGRRVARNAGAAGL